MNVRRARIDDGPAFVRAFQNRRGAFAEWGGVHDHTDEIAANLADPQHSELWAVEDGTVRGWVRMVGPKLYGGQTLWTYALGVIDASGVEFARLYLGAVKRIAEAHAGDLLDGSVVAGGALDRLWRRRIGAYRTVREGPRTGGGTLTEAYYLMPAEAVVRALGAF